MLVEEFHEHPHGVISDWGGGGELFWYPSSGGDFFVLQHFVNEIVHRAVTDLHFSSHFIDCYLLIIPYHSFHFGVSIRPIATWGWPERAAFARSDTPIFKLSVPFLYQLKWLTRVPSLPLHFAVSICRFLSFTAQEVKACRLFFIHASFQGGPHLWSDLLMLYF